MSLLNSSVPRIESFHHIIDLTQESSWSGDDLIIIPGTPVNSLNRFVCYEIDEIIIDRWLIMHNDLDTTFLGSMNDPIVSANLLDFRTDQINFDRLDILYYPIDSIRSFNNIQSPNVGVFPPNDFALPGTSQGISDFDSDFNRLVISKNFFKTVADFKARTKTNFPEVIADGDLGYTSEVDLENFSNLRRQSESESIYRFNNNPNVVIPRNVLTILPVETEPLTFVEIVPNDAIRTNVNYLNRKHLLVYVPDLVAGAPPTNPDLNEDPQTRRDQLNTNTEEYILYRENSVYHQRVPVSQGFELVIQGQPGYSKRATLAANAPTYPVIARDKILKNFYFDKMPTFLELLDILSNHWYTSVIYDSVNENRPSGATGKEHIYLAPQLNFSGFFIDSWEEHTNSRGKKYYEINLSESSKGTLKFGSNSYIQLWNGLFNLYGFSNQRRNLRNSAMETPEERLSSENKIFVAENSILIEKYRSVLEQGYIHIFTGEDRLICSLAKKCTQVTDKFTKQEGSVKDLREVRSEGIFLKLKDSNCGDRFVTKKMLNSYVDVDPFLSQQSALNSQLNIQVGATRTVGFFEYEDFDTRFPLQTFRPNTVGNNKATVIDSLPEMRTAPVRYFIKPKINIIIRGKYYVFNNYDTYNVFNSNP